MRATAAPVGARTLGALCLLARLARFAYELPRAWTTGAEGACSDGGQMALRSPATRAC